MNQVVVSFIGPDRLGLVDVLSNTIKQFNGNWQTSSMHHLSGFFAGVVEISIEKQSVQPLVDALTQLDGLNCQIEIAALNNEVKQANLVLELTANDRAGIVQDISSVIHRQGGNLLKLVSTQDSAAHSGQVMFKAKAQVSINEQHIDDIISAIEAIADDIMVDISR
jgi:glycine cleavage system regulatory protein